jgi:hypothetical protein
VFVGLFLIVHDHPKSSFKNEIIFYIPKKIDLKLVKFHYETIMYNIEFMKSRIKNLNLIKKK